MNSANMLMDMDKYRLREKTLSDRRDGHFLLSTGNQAIRGKDSKGNSVFL